MSAYSEGVTHYLLCLTHLLQESKEEGWLVHQHPCYECEVSTGGRGVILVSPHAGLEVDMPVT